MKIIHRKDLKTKVSRYSFFYNTADNKLMHEMHEWMIGNYPFCECLLLGLDYLVTDNDNDIGMVLKLTYDCDIEERIDGK